MDQQVRAARQMHQPQINLLAMLDIRANDERFPISLDPETVCSAGMVVLFGSNHGRHIVDAGEMLAGISDLQKLEIGSHVIQLHREIFRLHLDLENLPQIANCLVPAERQEGDFLLGIIGRGKERKALNVVPVKMRERDNDLFLLVTDGAKVSAQVSQSRPRVNDGDAVRIGERDLQAGGVAAELLKTGIADGDGSPRTIKLELHRIVFFEGKNSKQIPPAGNATKPSCKARRTLLAQQLLFRSGDLFEFVFADIRIFEIKIGEGFDDYTRNDNTHKPFVIYRHHIPVIYLRSRLLEHFLVRLHVVVPEIALGGVIG